MNPHFLRNFIRRPLAKLLRPISRVAALSLLPVNAMAAPVLFVDFGQHTSAPLQSGYEAFTPWGATSADNGNPVTQAYNRADATDGTIEVTMSGMTHWRDYSQVIGTYASQSDLLSDMALRNSNGTMVLTISDLKPGDYFIRTYHNNGNGHNGGIWTAQITDANRTDVSLGSFTEGPKTNNPTSVLTTLNYFTITDGDFVFKMTRTGGAHMNFNGFELNSVTPPAIASTFPADDEVNAWAENGKVEIKFDQPVLINGTGTLKLKNLTAGTEQVVQLSSKMPTEYLPTALPELKLWLDANDASTITHSSNSVSQWQDKSGNNNHATQGTAGSQPALTSNVINGKPAMDFDVDKMTFPQIGISRGMALAVVQPDTLSGAHQVFSHTSVNVQLRLDAAGGIRYAAGNTIYPGNPLSTGTISAGSPSIIAYVLNSEMEYSLNGSFEQSGVNDDGAGDTAFDQIAIRGASSEPYDGKIAELIMVKSVSTADRQKLEGYLAHKWGLTGNLPAGHPYKSSLPPPPSTFPIGDTLSHDFGSLDLNTNYAVQLSANAVLNSSNMLNTTGIADDTTLNFSVTKAAKQPPGITNLADEALPTGTDAKITFDLDSGERLFSVLSPTVHFDASNLASITKDGSNKVTQWNDISGNGRNATLAAGVPTYFTSDGPSGMPVIKFSRSGGDDYMDISGTFFAKDHYYVVKSPNSADRWDYYGGPLGHQSGRASNYLFQHNQPYFHNNQYPAAVHRNGKVLSGNFSLSDARLWMVVRLSVNSNSTTPKNNYRIGRIDNSFSPSMDIAEIIAFESDLPAASREQLEAHLAIKWGIAPSLDSSHAFGGTIASPFGALTANATVYYGKTDAGNNWGSWESSKSFGTGLSSGTVQDTLTGLDKETQYFYRVRSNNAAHQSVSQTESFTTPDGIPYLPAPVTIYGKKGQAISHDLDASILGIWTSLAATGLPAGLTLNTSTGVIEGSPVGGGTSDVNLTITGDSGSSQQTYTIKIVDLDEFAHTFPVTTSGYAGSETLADFPLLVRLGTAHGTDFSYNGFLAKGPDGKTTGHDLRVYEPSGRELAFEIEEWNQDGESKVWVRIPSLTSSTQLVLAWGNPAQTTLPAYAGDGSVWSNAYSAVYHMGAPQLGKQLDSSPFSHHADELGLQAGASANNIIGPHVEQAAESAGSLEMATASALDDVQEGSYTLSAWTRRGNNDGFIPNAFLARGYDSANTSTALDRDTMIADINPVLDHWYTKEKIWNAEDLEFTHDNHMKDAGIGLSYGDHMGFVAMSTFVVPETGAYKFKAYLHQGNCRSSGWLDLNKDGKFDLSEKLGTYSGNDWETGAINLTAGDRHDFALIYRHWSNNADFRPSIQTPTLTSWTIINPAAANQAGFWEVNPKSYWGGTYSPLGILQKGNFGFMIDPALKPGFKHSTVDSVVSLSATSATTTDQWNHLAATVDKATGQVKLYLDGALEASGSFTAGAAATEMGAAPFLLNSKMQSSFDEARIASAPRSADWIKAVYDNQKASSAVLSYGTVTGPPVFTSPLIVSTNSGAAFSYQMAASQSPTAFAAYNLPEGLTVNSSGLITGTPGLATTYPILLLAQYADGSVLGSPTASDANAVILQLEVKPVVPSITANAATNVAASSATLNGQITSDGGAPVSIVAYYGKTSGTVPTSFTHAPLTGDADSGVSSSYTYTAAVNLQGTTRTVNGVTFTGVSGTSGTGWQLTSGFTNTVGGHSTNVIGEIGQVINQGFRYAGDPQKLKLTGLTDGQHYVFTFYSAAWGTNFREMRLSSTDTPHSLVVNQNQHGDKNGSRFMCHYTAQGTEVEFTMDSTISGTTWHNHGFSNHEVATPPPFPLDTPVASQTWESSKAFGQASGTFDFLLTGLEPGTTYYYRLLGINAADANGSWSSEEQTFTTPTSTLPLLSHGNNEFNTDSVNVSGLVDFVGNGTLAGAIPQSFSHSHLTGDADSGVSNSHTYTCAVNVNGVDKVVNGVTFKGETGTSGTGWTYTAGFTSAHGSQATNVGGVIGEVLANGMRYNGDPQKIKLTGLTDGQHYVFSLYSQAWEASGRVATITCTDTPDVLTIDQSKYGSTNPEGLLVECRFTASGTEAEFTIDPVGGTWHLYAFSNREAASGPVYPDYTGVDLTLYWGTSDGGTDTSAWDSSVVIGNYYGLQEVDGFESRGWNMPYNATLKGFPTSDHWFNVNIEDLIAIPSHGQKVILSEPNNADGFYFNGDNDFRNAGIGITQNDNYTDIHQTYFTPQESGNFTFRMDERDDRYAMWMDLNQDGVYVKADGDFLGGPTTVNKTVSLQQGQQYKLLILHGEGGGGSKFRAWVDTPSLTDRVIKPLDPEQADFYKWRILSTGKFIEEQVNTVANLPGLASGSTYYYRLKGTNSLGTSWAPATDSFVFENKLDFDFGTLTFDTSAATWSHTSGKSGTGTIVEGSATTPEGDTLSFKKTEYKFDSIRLAGNLEVVLKGDNALSLQTLNNGDIDILVDLDASGGNGTGAKTATAGLGGNGPGGQGILGGGHGGDGPGENQNWGYPGGDPRNLVGAPVNGGGAYDTLYLDENGVITRDNNDTRGERGAGGSYAGRGTGGYWSGTSYLIAGQSYGEPTLSALLGGSGGSSQGRNGACSGGAGGGAIEIIAHGTGSVTVGEGKAIRVDGGDIPDHYGYSSPANTWYYGSGGGGSGGAIRIEGQNINIFGTLSATGGDRYWDQWYARGGAGGGGRIALFSRNSLAPGTIELRGGLDRGGNEAGGKGTLYVESASGGMTVLDASSGVVTIDSDLATLVYSGATSSGFAVGTPENKTVQVDGADFLLQATKFTFDRINIAGSAVLSIKGTKPVILSTRNHGDIVFNSSISLDGNSFGAAGAGGFPGGNGNTSGKGPGAGSAGIGGSYGGPADGASLVDTYGDSSLTELFGGSGGGGATDNNGAGGGGALAVITHGAGKITIGNNVTLSARGGNSDIGPGSGGALYFEADEIINNGSILAAGGKPETVAATANGGGGRIAMKTNKAITFGTVDAGNGTLSVIGDMGINTLNYDSGSLVFDTGSASWYHSGGQHGQGTLVDQYGFSGKNLPAAVFTFAGINLGHDLTVTVRGSRALVLKDTSSSHVLIRPDVVHNVAASGISIETDGDLTVGRDYGTVNAVGSTSADFTLMLRGNVLLNKATLNASGSGSRLVMGYPGSFTDQGTINATQRIDVTLPTITNTLTADAPYGATITDPVAKDDLKAWFLFEEGEGQKAYSEMGGFIGDFVGTDGTIAPVVHFDASNLASITKDGSDKVTQWNDLSGNARNATLGGGLPTYYGTGGSNNMPYVKFHKASNDYMPIPGSIFIKDHYYVVRNPNSTDTWDNYGGVLGYHGSRNSNYLFQSGQAYFHNNRYPSAVSRNGVVLSSNYSLTDTRQWMVVRLSVDTASMTDKTTYRLGRNDGYSPSFEVGEILGFPTDLPPAARAKVEGYLAHKWGVTLTAGHAYENSAPANFSTTFSYNGQPQFDTGKFGKALRLNGSASVAGGWLQTNAKPSDLGVGGNKPRTISFWIKAAEKLTEVGHTYAGLYGMGNMLDSHDAPYMGLGQFNANNQTSHHFWGNNKRDGANVYANVGEWRHITHRFDGNNQMRTRTNNASQDNYTKSLFTDSGTNSELTIGLATNVPSQRTPDRGFVGWIDDFRVYDRYLSDTEVGQIYNSGNGDGATAQPVVKVLAGDQGADRFSATGLPAGLSLDPATGRITGSTTAIGDHNVSVRAGNFLGFGDPKTLVISVLPIAPTMGAVASSNVQGSSAVVDFNVDHNGGEDVDVSISYNKNPSGWRVTRLTGDADSGVSSSHTYTAAINVKGSNKTVNGVTFTGSSATSGTGWQITQNFQNQHNSTPSLVTGGIGEVLSNGFRFNGDPQKIKMTGLTDGQHYIFSMYSQAWGTNGRWCNLSGSDTNDSILVSQDKYGNYSPDGLLVECHYTATGTEAEFVIDPLNSGSTWHLYGFANRVASAAETDTTVNLAGKYGNGSHQATLTGLDVSTTYFYKSTGTNQTGNSTTTTEYFTTEANLGPPVVVTSEATNIAGTSITANGKILSYDGNDQPAVTLYYDSEDRGATSVGWANSAAMGSHAVGDFSGNLTGLTPGTTYFYRFGATNAAGTAYSKSGAFATLGTPTAQGAIATQVSADSATINVRVTSIGGYSYTTYPGIQTDSIKDNPMSIWLDASALALNDGDQVVFWPDSSGNERHMPNKDGDPIYVAAEATVNGKPSVTFDGNDRLRTNHNFRSGSHLTTLHNIGYTAFGVSRYTGGDNERVIQSDANWFFGHDGGQTGRYHFDGWIDSTNSGGQTDFHLFAARHEGKAVNSNPRGWTWTDGIPGAIGHNGSSNDWYMPQRLTFGARASATQNSSKCQVSEFIMFDGELGEDDRLKVEGYLAHKYGLTLPNSHPWKTNIPFPKTISGGGDPVSVVFYWGDNDAGTNAAAWDESQIISGTHNLGIVSHSLTGLTKGTPYFYTAQITNSAGTVWAPVKTFTPANTLLGKYSIPDLALWLDSSDVDGDGTADTLADGTALDQWTDKSISGNHATQASGSSARPTLATQALGNRSAVRFDGVNDNLFLQQAIRDTAGPVSAYAVFARPVAQDSGGNSARLLGSADFDILTSNGNVSGAVLVDYHSASKRIQNLKVGREDSSSSNFFQGDLLEVLVFTRELTTTEQQQAVGYLVHKYGIPETLSDTHPYREFPPAFDNNPKITPKDYIVDVDTTPVWGFKAISANEMAIWFDASSLSYADGEVVEQWPDISGKGRSMIYKDGDPVFTASESTANNKPVVTFDGNDRLRIAHNFRGGSSLTKIRATGYSAFGVSRYSGATKRRVISSHGGNYLFGHHGGQTGRYHFDGWIDSTNAGGLEDFHVFIARMQGKDMAVSSNPLGWTWTDGVQGANGHGGSNNDWYMPQHLTFGAQGSATQESSTCQVAEFVMFYGEISETDRLKAEAYLALKYGVGLPSGHVYENGLPYQGEYNHVFFAGVPNTYQIEATNGPETYAEDGALAARGLTLDTATGLISGVPNALGDFHVTITVSNSSGDVSKDFFFSVNKGTRVLDWSQTLPALTYGDDPITMTATSVGAGDITYTSSDTSVLEVSGSTVTIKASGTADLTVNAPATALTNAAAPITKNITVAKATIQITAEDASRLVGQANPSFTYLASGFVNGDTSSVITTAPTITPTDGSGNAIPDNSNTVGSFDLIPSAADATNYLFTYQNGVFTVDDRTVQTVTWTQDLSSTALGDTIALSASATSSLPVAFASSDESVAKLVVTRDFHLDAWWRFDEASGTQGSDQSGNNRLLATQGTPSWVAGKFGNALSFDGTNDQAGSFGYKGITGTAKRTYALWLKTSTTSRGILFSGAASGAGMFSLSLDGSGNLKVDYGNGSVLSNATVNNDAWRHVAVTLPLDGTVSQTKIYIDGADATGAATNGSNAVSTGTLTDLTIGKDGSTYFSGLLDDVRVYVGELDSSEVSGMYNQGVGDFNRLRIIGAGPATITAKQHGNATYAPSNQVSKAITVGKQDQTISFATLPDQSVGDFDFDPGASASSGLIVSYTSSNPDVAQIVGVDSDGDGNPDPGTQKIRPRAAGSAIITATQAGSANFNAATAAQQTVTVNYFNLFEHSIAGMQWWFDANNVDADNNPDVKTDQSAFFNWNDKSSNNRNAVQATAGNMPVYNANGLDGKATIKFDADDTLNLPSTPGTKLLFAVIKQDASQTAVTAPFGGDLAGTTASGNWGLQRTGASMLDSGVTSNLWAVVVYKVKAGSYSIYVNGLEKATGTDASGIAALDKIGGTLKGEIAEAVAYDRVLPSLTRRKIEAYLAHKWGLVGNLPAAHPHKLSRPTFGGAQEIVFQPLPDKTPESAPFRLLAESGSGLPVTFTSGDTSIATIVGDIVTPVAEGTVTITANQAGDGNWFPANPTTQDLKITAVPRSDQIITFNPLADKQIGDADFNLTASSNSGLAITYTSTNTGVATVSGNTVTLVGQGITKIRAAQAGDSNWNPAIMVEQELKVIKRNQAITFAAIPSQLLSAGVYNLTATSDSGLAPAFAIDDTSIATIQGNTLTLKAGGTAQVTATQAGNITYNAASPVTQTLTVVDDTLQPQTITFNQDLSGKSLGDADFALTATVNSGLSLTFSSSNTAVATISGNTVSIKGAGTTTITVLQPGTESWQAASATKQLVIAKADQTITFPTITDKVAGGLDFYTGASASSGLDIAYTTSDPNVAILSGDKVILKGAGSVTITASQPGNDDYNAATDVAWTFNVTETNFFADSYPGLRLWLDANDINGDRLADQASDFLSGGKINTWKDRSGNGFDATQSQITRMPVFQANAQNGRPVVGFSDSFLDIPNLYLGGSKDRSIFIVGKSAQGPFFSIGQDQASQRLILGRDTVQDKLGISLIGPGGHFVSAGSVANMSISSAILQGNKLRHFKLSVNGTQENAIGEAAVDTVEEGRNRIGAYLDGNGRLHGQIAEILVFDSAVTASMAAKIEGYLAIKWGLRTLLPADHTHKSADPSFGGSQTITFPPIADQVVSTGTLHLQATSDSGLPLLYSSSDTTVFSIVGNVGTIHKQGSVTVTASHPGDSHYTAAADKTRTFTISKEDQTIVFTSPPDMNKLDPDIQLLAFSSSGLPIRFTIVSGPARIKPGTTDILQLDGVGGNVTITASQSGNVAYNAATTVSHTIEVNNNEPQSITFKGPGEDGSRLRNFQLGPRPFLIPLASLSGGSSGNPVELAVTGGTAASSVYTSVVTRPDGKKFFKIRTNSPGTLQITATQSGGTFNSLVYNDAAPVTHEITVRPASKANYLLSMRDNPDYATRLAKYQSRYSGKTNPDTGSAYTTQEIIDLYEGDDGDPDRDGLSNLMEYAFGGDSFGRDGDEKKYIPRRKPLKRNSGGPQKFQLTFARRSSANDPNLTYTVETSTDMINWTTAGLTEASSVTIDGGMELVTYELDKPFTDPDAPKNQFMRINVSSTE